MSIPPIANLVRQFRLDRDWSQAELASRVRVSRAAISAIEQMRLIPSVATALALAAAFDCTVETLFAPAASLSEPVWAAPPLHERCRYWHAKVGNRIVRYSAEEAGTFGPVHDGIFRNGDFHVRTESDPNQTLVIASCDPAASLLAAEYNRTTSFRLLTIPCSSRNALKFLGQGLVHCAGIHFASSQHNDRVVAKELGSGYRLLHVAIWQEGLAIAPGAGVNSVEAAVKARTLRWIGREAGSAARQCLDELRSNQSAPRRIAFNHRGVAEALRSGWADVGVCHRLVAEENGLRFLTVRKEPYELCFPAAAGDDPRIVALIRLLRSPACRQTFGEMPGLDSRQAGAIRSIA